MQILLAPTEDVVLREKTALSADEAAAQTTLSVYNPAGFTVGDFVIVDELGSEISELKKSLIELREELQEQMQTQLEEKLRDDTENKLKNFDEIYNAQVEQLKKEIYDMFSENMEIITTTPRNNTQLNDLEKIVTDLRSEMEKQTIYIQDLEEKVKKLEAKPKIILNKK